MCLIEFGMRHFQSVLFFSAQAISFGLRSCMSVAIVAMTDVKSGDSNFPIYDWDSEKKSLILSSVLWGCVLTQVPLGYLTTQGGSKKFLCFCMLLTGIVNMLTPILASKLGWIAVICSRIIIGMCQGATSPCLHNLISNWAPPSERARLGSFVVNGAQFGNVLFMSVSGVLAESKFGWPSIFYVFGIITIVWAILFWFLSADSPSEHPKISPKELVYIDSSLEKLDTNIKEKDRKIPLKSMFTSLPVWSLLIVSSGQGWCYYIFFNQLPSYMKYILKFDIQESGGMSSLPYLAMWLMGFPYSWLSDFALHKGVSTSFIRKVCNTIAMWGPALALLGLCLIETDNKAIYVIIFIIALGLNAGVTSGFEINHIDLSPNFAGAMVAFTNSIVKICGCISPIVCGIIVSDMTNKNQWSIIFYSTALIYFLTNIIFMLFGTAEKQSWNHKNLQSCGNGKPRVSVISTTFEGDLEYNVKTVE